jgi:hypothetical protein
MEYTADHPPSYTLYLKANTNDKYTVDKGDAQKQLTGYQTLKLMALIKLMNLELMEKDYNFALGDDNTLVYADTGQLEKVLSEQPGGVIDGVSVADARRAADEWAQAAVRSLRSGSRRRRRRRPSRKYKKSAKRVFRKKSRSTRRR